VDGLGWDDLDGVCDTVLTWPLDARGAWVLEAADDPLAERRLLVRWELIQCIIAGRIYWGGSGELVGIRAFPQLPGGAGAPTASVDIPELTVMGNAYYPVGLSTALIGRLFELSERERILRPTTDHLSITVSRPQLFSDPLRVEVEGAATTLRRPLLAITTPGEEGPVAHAGWLPGPSVAGRRRNGLPALQLWSTVPLW
jgi:hypothetical protein